MGKTRPVLRRLFPWRIMLHVSVGIQTTMGVFFFSFLFFDEAEGLTFLFVCPAVIKKRCSRKKALDPLKKCLTMKLLLLLFNSVILLAIPFFVLLLAHVLIINVILRFAICLAILLSHNCFSLFYR